jgi:hypothetical protein
VTDVLFGGPADLPDEHRRPTQMRVLVTVKAAPNPSVSYGETVCVAGLRLDLGHEGWVRLYPINFRFIEESHTFKKYDVVTLHAVPASEGRRESWKPRIDTLQSVAHLDGWDRRMPVLGPFAHDTMCELNANSRGGRSLGLVKARVSKLVLTRHPGWTRDEQQKIDAYINQPELFDLGKPKTALEAPRFRGTYHWHCPAPACRGHEQGLLDWEFTAFQRRLPPDDADAMAAIQQRWFNEVCSPNRDVYFYVGNQAKRHQTFSVLGIVWPKR